MKVEDKTRNELKAMGFSDVEINEAAKEVEFEEKTGKPATPNPMAQSAPTIFSYRPDENLIKWQLDLSELMERAEHILRGDTLKYVDGHQIWVRPDNEDEQILNDLGIQEVMRILSMYINRNTVLSNYDEDTINVKVYDFGKELSNLFFMKYEVFGWNPDIQEGDSQERRVKKMKSAQEKRKNYYMLVREMVDIVHSAYLRALHGGERQSLREARQVTQTEPLMGPTGQGGMNFNINPQRQERSIVNPMRLIKGKYI